MCMREKSIKNITLAPNSRGRKVDEDYLLIVDSYRVRLDEKFCAAAIPHIQTVVSLHEDSFKSGENIFSKHMYKSKYVSALSRE